MASSMVIPAETVRCMIPAEVGTRPVTEFGTDTPKTDEHGRPLHHVRDLTMVVDGQSLTESSVVSTREQQFPAGAIIQPKGAFKVRISARAKSAKFAIFTAQVEAEAWEAVGSVADLLGVQQPAQKEAK